MLILKFFKTTLLTDITMKYNLQNIISKIQIFLKIALKIVNKLEHIIN
jgi:hypothetical protein